MDRTVGAAVTAVAVVAAVATAGVSMEIAPQTVERFESQSVVVSEDGMPVTFSYRLLRPEVAAGTRRSVVLFLHGSGERGVDNVAQLSYLPAWLAEPEARAKHPCFVVAPQCRAGRMWVDVSWSDKESSPQRPALTTDLAAAVAALDAVLADPAADPDRVIVTGISMGGYGTWDLAARMPERFAAALPICGGGDERTAAALKAVPIWCFHGAEDAAVPVERSRRMVAAVRQAGGEPRYTEFPGVGHDAWTPAYRDPAVLDWLFSRHRGE